MRITTDTNVLVRAVVADDPAQSQAAIAALRDAEQIAVALLQQRGIAAELLS